LLHDLLHSNIVPVFGRRLPPVGSNTGQRQPQNGGKPSRHQTLPMKGTTDEMIEQFRCEVLPTPFGFGKLAQCCIGLIGARPPCALAQLR